MPKNQKGPPAGRQGFAHILLLILLLAGIALGVYLVQQKTNLFPKAFFPPSPPVIEPTTSFALSPSFTKLPDPVPLFQSEEFSSISSVANPIQIKLSYEVGDIVPVALLVRSDIDETNLFVAKLKFDKDLLEVVSVKLPDIPVNSQSPISSLSFIKNWVEQNFDNSNGSISLVGGVPAPGYKTNTVDQPGGLMTMILFKAKKAGSTSISFTDESAIYRNTDNQNILINKVDAIVSIKETESCAAIITSAKDPGTGECKDFPTPCDVPEGWEKMDKCEGPPPSCEPRPACLDATPPCLMPEPPGGWCLPSSIKIGDGNKDGKIDLVDMSVLLSWFNKTGYLPPIDMNDDGVVNTFDFSLHRKVLLELGVIK